MFKNVPFPEAIVTALAVVVSWGTHELGKKSSLPCSVGIPNVLHVEHVRTEESGMTTFAITCDEGIVPVTCKANKIRFVDQESPCVMIQPQYAVVNQSKTEGKITNEEIVVYTTYKK